jgi:hypothetical protein
MTDTAFLRMLLRRSVPDEIDYDQARQGNQVRSKATTIKWRAKLELPDTPLEAKTAILRSKLSQTLKITPASSNVR